MSSSFEDPRRVLKRHGLWAKRSYSQNFLVSERAVAAIAEACALAADTPVIELGAGCGTLTFALAERSAHVIAIERDPDMLRVLEAERGERAVELVPGDAKQIDFAEYARRYGRRVVVAGNLPYAITGAIFRNLVAQAESVERAVFMVQREVRDRLVAEPDSGEYGALTIFTAQRFAIATVLHLPRTAFHPPPKVTSSVVALTPLAAPRAPLTPEFETLVRAAFQARRKTLRNALAQSLGAEPTQRALQAAGIDGQRRGETLSIEEFGALAAALRHTQAGE
ncbi:MAG TPA: 16S rRNA (adenine(1518)-N(6)/adenine(1519)-N(6))-dimethyltransferase RsmA [Polyangiales bacterium]|nr:16S rRNA (adenine(1518)-N(6)/adenine(1519)-N(6))-dimethyltransferase RsmA [Polyangiales bacterium]